MSVDVDGLVKKYIEAWNTTDLDTRRSLLGEVFTETGRYTDPQADVTGVENLVTHLTAERAAFGDLMFDLVKVVSVHHETLLFTWRLGVPGGDPVATGYDAVIVAEGKFQQVYGYFD
ncbi:nuclear transport factor 2 family protein [Saccharothrix sp. HUAS TT1]|uniref:nuclear transport factor 2 family protein n=1 Tax=unclassified Saccharothrix TaxID=2593673 RepID=UPI00345C4E96